MEIQIEKGIPIPEKKRQFKKKYPLDSMEVGDSFFVPNVKQLNIWGRARSMAPKKFRSLKVDGGIRVWRYE